MQEVRNGTNGIGDTVKNTLMKRERKWEEDNYCFLEIGKTISTAHRNELNKFYENEIKGDYKYSIKGYKKKLVHMVYDVCYGEYVSINQNFMIDQYLTGHINETDYFRPIARTISKSCFSIGVIKLSNLLNRKHNQVYSLRTMEILLKNEYPKARFESINTNHKEVGDIVRKLRDKFYAHRDFNEEIESDKLSIWSFVNIMKNYFSEVKDQVNRQPKNYENYITFDEAKIRSFLQQKVESLE